MTDYGSCEYTKEIYVQFGGLTEPDDHVEWEVTVEMKCVHPGDPGKLYGPPENCWPPEPREFEWIKVRVFTGDLTILETDRDAVAQQFFNLKAWEKLLEEADEWAVNNHELPGRDEDES